MAYGIVAAPPRFSPQAPGDHLRNWLDLTDWLAETYPGDTINAAIPPTVTASPAGLTIGAVALDQSGARIGVLVTGGVSGTDYTLAFSFALVSNGSLTRSAVLPIAPR